MYPKEIYSDDDDDIEEIISSDENRGLSEKYRYDTFSKVRIEEEKEIKMNLTQYESLPNETIRNNGFLKLENSIDYQKNLCPALQSLRGIRQLILLYYNKEPRIVEGLESLSEISSKYTERSSIAVKSPRTKMENFLEPQSEENKGRKTLVLDLDETLVHSTFNPPNKGEGVPDMLINVEWDNGERDKVFVRVRPYTYKFLAKMSKIFEIVIFTASILNYAKPLIYKLDKKGLNFQILSRAQCTLINNCYYKDLSRLGRDLKNVIMIDNSPQAYSWQRENGIPIISWFGNARDSQLNKLIPVLQRLAQVEDVREIIPNIVGNHSVNYYEAFKALKAPRESSPLDDFLNTLTRLKREAAAFFSGNELNNNLTEENKDSQENHEEETKKDFSSAYLQNNELNIEERHQTDPGYQNDDFIDHNISLFNPRSKPTLIKVAPKTVKINKSGSLKVLCGDKLHEEEEKLEIDNELEMQDNSDIDNNINSYSSKVVVTEPSNPTETAKIDLLEADNYSK